MLNRTVKIYMGIVILSGLVVLTTLTVWFPVRDWFALIFFTLLGIVSESQTVEINNSYGVSITIAITTCAMLLGGVTPAIWVAVGSVFGSVVKKQGGGYYHVLNTPIQFTLVSACVYVLSIAADAGVYFSLGGKTISASYETFGIALSQLNSNALPLLIATTVSIFVNTILVATYMSIRQKQEIFRTWVSQLLWSIINLAIVGLVGVIITSLYAAYGWFLVLLFFAPFLLARYVFSIYKELQHNYLQTVKSLAYAIEAKDEYTIGHSKRVEFFCAITAAELRLPAKRCEHLRYAALLHDIGKIGIDERILNKKEKLTDDEWNEIRQHPEKGAHIVEGIEFLADAVEIIRSHHERVDGNGYPHGLSGGQLSTESMILCVADAYDAMTSDRPYRKALSQETALAELRRGASHQFSPEVVDAFERAVTKKGNSVHAV